MKPGNESLLFSWSARLVAMDPKAKIGPWRFREVGGGFSELYLTLWPGSGLVLKSVFSVFTTGGNGAAQSQVGSQRAGDSALAMGHHWYSTSSPARAAGGCAQGQCEQEEQRQDVTPKPLRGGEPLPLRMDNGWGALGLYMATSQTVMHISTYRKPEQKNKENNLLNLIEKSDSG